jgi:hypothetical protein
MGGEGGNATDVVGQRGVSRYARTAVIRSTYPVVPRERDTPYAVS